MYLVYDLQMEKVKDIVFEDNFMEVIRIIVEDIKRTDQDYEEGMTDYEILLFYGYIPIKIKGDQIPFENLEKEEKERRIEESKKILKKKLGA